MFWSGIGQLVWALSRLAPRIPLAHGGEVTRNSLPYAWQWEPMFLVGVAVLALAYLRGVQNVWQRAGVGHGARWWQVAAFASGMNLLLLALISPLDALSDALFSAHMVQHMLLVFAVAPLLALSNLLNVLLWALPRPAAHWLGHWWTGQRALQRLAQTVTQPVGAWALLVGSLWVWHTPALYEAALRNDIIHDLEHIMFLLAAILFWWVLLRLAEQRIPAYGSMALMLFAALLQGNALGALLTFTGRPLYPVYGASTAAWGLSPLEDQQLGGVIMWVPGHLIFMLTTIAVLYAWLMNAAEPRQAMHQKAG